jgi:pimeloyl-ACP methyl ester carboxylesterase
VTALVDTFFVTVGRTKVRVRTQGSGPPLLMIMGIGGNLDMWAPLAAQLSGRELIMFDFPGTGGSMLLRQPPTMAGNALFTRSLVRRLAHEQVDVLGYSWGGMLAQQLAIQHPSVVRRLVLAATGPGLGGTPPSPLVAARMLTPRRYHSRRYFAKVAGDLYGGRMRHRRDLVAEEVRRRSGRPPGMAGYTAQLLAATYSSLPGLRCVSAPTLIIGGDDDPIVAIRNQHLLARRIRNAQVHIIAGAGHLLLVDSPDVVAPVIEEFLARP